MAQTVVMPQLGESVTEGTIARWLKQPGEPVERYESIAEVVTDKVNAEIPAPAAGTMGEHLVAEGAVVPVGAPICRIEAAEAVPADTSAAAAPALEVVGEPAPPLPVAAAAASAPAPASPPEQATPPASATPPATIPAVPAAAGAGNGSAGAHVTPAVRMLAREHGIDLDLVPGTGIGGRVTKKDVLSYVQRLHSAAPPPAAPAPPPPSPVVTPARALPAAAAPASAPVPAAPAPAAAMPVPAAGETVVPLTSARRAIAEHMVRSRHTSPHAWTLVEVDMSAIARVRVAHRASFRETSGADLTFLPFVARAVISALRRHPTLNASWSDDGIVLHRDINLGIAVALEANLVVPVLRGADTLNLVGLARALADLTERARSGRLRVDELSGGTFTLNNAGALGTVLSQAIINQPQAAICVMDAIVKRPVVVGDAIAIRSMMNLSVSFDHRVNDGLGATRFLVDVKGQLEGIDEGAPLA